jgi:glycosyltransferase involved in cell wall biosynthesis
MKLSVIICTHNPRAEFLQRTLEALRNQTLPKKQWELLLIDNASTVPLAGRADISWQPHARHLLEGKLGKLNAWLLGMREARADILLFVDDDNVLAPDYLEQALVVGEQWPFIGAWGGSIIPEYEKPLPAWVGSNVWRLTVLDVKEDIWSNLREDFSTIPVGAGLCVRSTVANKYLERCDQNPVSAKLDRAGAGLGGYGDIDLSCCAMDLGMGTGRSTRLCLTHLIAAGRLTLDYFVRHAEGDAVSMMLFRASRGLSISEPKPMSWLGYFRWYIHRLKNRIPREQYEISKAHQRGLKRGWKLAQNYLQGKSISN